MNSVLPAYEAIFNGISTVLILLAILSIKNGKKMMHRNFMIGAVLSSICFLVCYLIYHFNYESVAYQGDWKILYRFILISHIILAFTVPYFVTITLLRAWRGQFVSHKKIARVAAPIWLYVSITGILVYYMVHT